MKIEQGPCVAEIGVLPLIPIDAERLRAVCTIQIGDAYDRESIAETAVALRNEAFRLGFPGARIVLRHDPLTTSSLAVDFIVEGATPPELSKVRIKGAGWINGHRACNYLKHLEPIAFDKGTTVTAALLQNVEGATTAFMRAQGYLEARARLAETSTNPKGVNVTYRVERGPRFRIAASQATGIRFPDPADWKPATEDLENKPLTVKRIRELEDAITERAREDGYMAPTVEMEFVPSADEHEVTVTAHIDEGTTSTLGEVKIERVPPENGYGKSWYHRRVAPPVAEEIIRKQIRARMGDTLNHRVLDDASRRLWRLGTFDQVDVDTTATSSSLVRDLFVKVRSQRTGSFVSSLGWADEIGPIGRLKFSEGNFHGCADMLTLGISATNAGLGGEVSYLDRYWERGERWLGEDREPSLLWSAYLNARGYDQYEERHAGGSLGLSYLLGDTPGPWSNSWLATVEQVSYQPYETADRYKEDFSSYLAATLAWHLTYDMRDRGDWDSTRGLLFDTSLETGFARGFLLKWTTRMDWRRPIARRWTWLVQGEMGLMPLNATSVGLSHRCHAGGLDGIRGFRYRGLGPVDPKNDELHIGGATLLTLRNEIRYHFNDKIQLPFFFDLGSLSENPFGWGGLRASAGLGIRYHMSDSNKQAYLYFAQNLLREKTDDEQIIRFGFSFDF